MAKMNKEGSDSDRAPTWRTRTRSLLPLVAAIVVGAGVMVIARFWLAPASPPLVAIPSEDGFTRLVRGGASTAGTIAGIAGGPPVTYGGRENDGAQRAPLSLLEVTRGSPVGGNPDGSVTIVEFFDYQCPFCRAVAPDLKQFAEKDKRIRYLFMEWPILGPDSERAARAALAAHRQGKYEAFHFALMATRGVPTPELIDSVARRVGLDRARLEQDMKDPSIDTMLDETRRLASRLRIGGTPAFVIGKTIITGAVGKKELANVVDSFFDGAGNAKK